MIQGLRPVSLVDYPGDICTTVFTGGCNYNCPWCHNRSLVEPASYVKNQTLHEEEVLSYLSRRRSRVPSICITGGEPSLWGERLKGFMGSLKSEGFKVKLDTNGSNPDFLQVVFQAGLADFVAMDLKNSPERYAETAGLDNHEMEHVMRSIDLIKHSGVAYQFRTTVVPGLVDTEAVTRFAESLGVSVVFQEYRNPQKNPRFI